MSVVKSLKDSIAGDALLCARHVRLKSTTTLRRTVLLERVQTTCCSAVCERKMGSARRCEALRP